MDAVRLAVIAVSVVLAATAVILAVGTAGPPQGRRILQIWTVLAFLVVGIVLWLHTRE